MGGGKGKRAFSLMKLVLRIDRKCQHARLPRSPLLQQVCANNSLLFVTHIPPDGTLMPTNPNVKQRMKELGQWQLTALKIMAFTSHTGEDVRLDPKEQHCGLSPWSNRLHNIWIYVYVICTILQRDGQMTRRSITPLYTNYHNDGEHVLRTP